MLVVLGVVEFVVVFVVVVYVVDHIPFTFLEMLYN